MTPNTIDREQVAEVLGTLKRWHHDCHAASTELVGSGVLGDCRVARGACTGVGGQHSWVVLGDDCYDATAEIVDPTLWSYDSTVEGIWYGSYRDKRHTPFGKGSIFRYGRPDTPTGEIIKLSAPLSRDAQSFLDLLGPLDRRGWAVLAHAPIGNWPAAEILGAMHDDPRLSALVPIDIIGMLTYRIPSYISPTLQRNVHAND